MGRVVGVGGCYFEVVDIAVNPEIQKQGLGGLIMSEIMCYIIDYPPESAYVSLIADHHSAQYSTFGFEPTVPVAIGAAYKIKQRIA